MRQTAPYPGRQGGSRANCPGCGDPITVPTADSAANEQYDQFEDDDADDRVENFRDNRYQTSDDRFDEAFAPSRIPDNELQRCPMCGEQVEATANRCRYCSEPLEPSLPEPERYEPQGEIQATIIDPAEVISTSWEIFKSEMALCVIGFIVSGLCFVAVMVMAFMGLLMVGALGAAGGRGEAVVEFRWCSESCRFSSFSYSHRRTSRMGRKCSS